MSSSSPTSTSADSIDRILLAHGFDLSALDTDPEHPDAELVLRPRAAFAALCWADAVDVNGGAHARSLSALGSASGSSGAKGKAKAKRPQRPRRPSPAPERTNAFVWSSPDFWDDDGSSSSSSSSASSINGDNHDHDQGDSNNANDNDLSHLALNPALEDIDGDGDEPPPAYTPTEASPPAWRTKGRHTGARATSDRRLPPRPLPSIPSEKASRWGSRATQTQPCPLSRPSLPSLITDADTSTTADIMSMNTYADTDTSTDTGPAWTFPPPTPLVPPMATDGGVQGNMAIPLRAQRRPQEEEEERCSRTLRTQRSFPSLRGSSWNWFSQHLSRRPSA